MGGEPGQIVVAPLDGIVSFAGQVAGRGVLTLGHGEHSTTYEPVTPLVSAGDSVIEGEAIAILDEGHACSAEACLHWGLRLGETYLNPLSLIDPSGIPRHIRLLPDEEVDELRTRRAEGAAGPRLVSAAGFVSPAAGVVSSDYGWRIHPVYGDERFHDGLDIAAPCGAPLAAAVGGVVTEVFYHSGYGHRLLIDHGLIDGVHVTTAYNHAEGYEVSVGEIVSTGQVIGAVGTTGTSTGCHLHFQVWTDDVLVDPAGFLP
jgi:murein DD-endopeptidase MepM/ murein hydrolase activator NlpD